MSKPHKEFDASKLAVHQPVGKETTKHLKGRENIASLSQHFLNLTPGIDKLVEWFWLLHGQNHPENHNILLVPDDPKHALGFHQPVGKETTKHLKGSSLSQHFLNLTPYAAREAGKPAIQMKLCLRCSQKTLLCYTTRKWEANSGEAILIGAGKSQHTIGAG